MNYISEGKETKVFSILSESNLKQIVDYIFTVSPERVDYLTLPYLTLPYLTLPYLTPTSKCH